MSKHRTTVRNGTSLPDEVAAAESFDFQIRDGRGGEKTLRATPCPQAITWAHRQHNVGFPVGRLTTSALMDILFMAVAVNYPQLKISRWDEMVEAEMEAHGSRRLNEAAQKAVLRFAEIMQADVEVEQEKDFDADVAFEAADFLPGEGALPEREALPEAKAPGD